MATKKVETKTGMVKFFNAAKGYGFITCDSDNKEYFVHATGCVDTLKKEDSVTFELQEGKRGLMCVNVTTK